MSALFHLLVLLATIGTQQVRADRPDNRTSLHLLNVLHFPESREDADRDSAFLLIPAAQLAVDQINNASHILPGYKLSLVNVEAEACSASIVTNGIINTYAKLFTPGISLNVVGFTGLFCSVVTNALTLIYGVPNMTYLQFAGSTTPRHRDDIQFPWLVHFRSSTATFNEAMMEILATFNWTTVSVVFEYDDFFYESLADDLSKQAEETQNFRVTARIPITGNTENVLAEINSRVVYVSASDVATVELMCLAYKLHAEYPGFVYILPEKEIPQLLSRANTTECSQNQLLAALESALTMNYKLSNGGEHKLVSNMTYQEYRHQYLQYLMEMELVINTTLSKESLLANVMYDQIWAFALTLGKSFDSLQAANISLEKLQLHQTKQLASILRSQLESLLFEGASAHLHLNSDGDESSIVEVFQVINGISELVAMYDPDVDKELELLQEFSFPPDTFEIRTFKLSSWVSTFFNIYVVFWVSVTTFVVVFLCVFKHRPEVKASSPSLSLVMIIGCYFLFASTLARNVTTGYLIANINVFTLLCNIEEWFAVIGLVLTFSALLMRLLRVSQIFNAYRKLSQFWKDKYMILSILTICSGEIILLILWTAVDTIRAKTTTTYQPQAIPHFFKRKSVCSNKSLGVWLLLTLSYCGVLMLIVVFIAVRTRKIRRSNFKNTKQVNILIMATCMSIGISIPMSLVSGIRETTFGHFILCFAYSCTAVYCNLFIFLPQVFITVLNMKAEKRGRKDGTTQVLTRESQFSNYAVQF